MLTDPDVMHGTWVVVQDPAGRHIYQSEEPVEGAEVVEGWCSRMVAPGYQDVGEWIGVYRSDADACRALLFEHGDELRDDVRMALLLCVLREADFRLLARAIDTPICVSRSHVLSLEGLVDGGRLTANGSKMLRYWCEKTDQEPEVL